MYNTQTQTYTVIDIRKTFENFQADIAMIAMRTSKWSQNYVEDICHDVIKLAEAKYLETIDIILMNSSNDVPKRATRFTVDSEGKTMTGDRAGGNTWPNEPNTYLTVVIRYTNSWFALREDERTTFRSNSGFKIGWSGSSIDTSYSHLTKQNGKLYGSKGYELKKENFE